MHTDEAVHADKFRKLIEQGQYAYDPNEFHGPTLNYFTLIPARLESAATYTQITELTLRIVPVAFGVAMILATVLVVMVVGRGLLEHFPMAALGALVIYAAVGLVDIAEFRRLARFRRSEFMLAIATTVAVLLLGVLYGVLFAIALSIVDLLRRVARPHDAVLGYVQGMAGMHDVDDYPEATPVPGLVVYRYDAPLFFANAQDFRERAMRAVDDATGPVEWFVLNCETNIDPDITAVDAMEQLRGQLAERGITFAMARVKQDLWDDLLAAGLIDRVGEDRIFPTLPTAVEAFRNRPDR